MWEQEDVLNRQILWFLAHENLSVAYTVTQGSRDAGIVLRAYLSLYIKAK